ncbi:hypothetical protein BXT84_13515 [Sulfobacillus thermotolerans]|uniref:EamA domain-containing protein n=1 Tax=Sulfobacillus thermotolerans TaxID=338644 RepID=A0ABM6RTR8_9FIRM|nr:hypothetical protein BXT84_13515 [Sulfobacillus thermotolerans]
MNLLAAGLVSASSFLHLGWNTAVRSTEGSLRFVWILVLSGGLFAALITIALGIPWHLQTVWPWVLATITIHSLYFSSLAQSYRQGALQDVYPAARGMGIVLSIPIAWGLFRQVPGLWPLVGALLIAVAVIVPAFKTRSTLRTLGWVLSVALFIALYSAVDSHSVHLISPWPYIACQYLGTALLLTPWALKTAPLASPKTAILSGIVSVVSYLLILYAYQLALVGPVLALRQISIAFAPVMGWAILKEPWQPHRLASTFLILIGVALIVFH